MGRFAVLLVIAIVASGAAPAEGQAPVRAVPAVHITVMPEAALTRRSDPKAVVDRILSFDADGDDRVTADELPERMHATLQRADRNGDGFLTAGEVSPPAGPTVPVTGGGSFRVNRSSSLADVVDDLKLPPPVRERAMAIVNKYRVPRNVNDSDSISLHAAMKELLDEEDFGNFAAAAARLRSSGFTVRTVVRPGGTAGSTPAP